jgi:hypothetical protein
MMEQMLNAELSVVRTALENGFPKGGTKGCPSSCHQAEFVIM